MQTNSRPIFIGGLDRCGKTTLRAFLVSHPNISIPAVGSNMWTYFYGQFGDLSDPENTTGLVMPPSGGRPDLSDQDFLAIIAHLRAQ